MEYVIAFVILAIVLGYVVRRLYKSNMVVPQSAERYVSDEEAEKISAEMQEIR